MTNCHICKSGSFFLLKKDDFDLYKCKNCELVFVYPLLDEIFLAKKIYSKESGYHSNRAEDLSLMKENSRATIVLDFFKKNKGIGRVLDVGCSGGHFLFAAKKRGFEPFGVEVNETTAVSAKKQGFNVFNGLLKDALFEKDSFDFIFLGEIIEHVNNPRDFIKQCSSFLKKDGFMAITTPNIDCAWSKTTFWFYKKCDIPWSSVTPPYHLHQFNSDNLDLLMKQEGFGVISTKFLRIPPIKYELGMLHLLKRYKNTRKFKDFLFMVFSYAVYTVTHTLFKLLHPFLKKDFQMIKIYKKTDAE